MPPDEANAGKAFVTPMSTEALKQQTIQDFGDQWLAFRDNDGYYASTELLRDVCGPLLDPAEFRGTRVADIGSGTGRIVRMLLDAGAAHVTAVEPSAAIAVLRENLAAFAGRVTLLNVPGDELPPGGDLDFVVSIGVIHHIPDPLPVLQAARAALKPGGRVLIWVYGREGNAAYLAAAQPLRAITRRLPHAALWALSWLLWLPLRVYGAVSRVLPLPLAHYFREHLLKLSPRQQVLTIYDQLNPAYAKYYRRTEVEELLAAAGFEQVALHHRHGYSWTALAVRPTAPI
jgi:SAM-dependent methyltransferase